MERNAAETAAAQPLESTMGMEWKTTHEDPASDHNRYVDLFLAVASLAYKKESVTKPTAFIDSILKNSWFFVIFVVFLVGRYANHISMYQVLFCVSLTPLFLCYYVKYVPFLFLEEDIKWIRRESKLLNAILEDAGKVIELRAHIDTKAQQILDPSLFSGGMPIEGLDQTAAAWLAKTKSVVRKAKYLVETFEKQRRDSRKICLSMMSINSFMKIEGLFIETKSVKEDINERISMKKVQGINICESLERARSRIRSLLDRPIHEQNQEKWVDIKGRVASAADLTSSIADKINGLINQNPDLMRKRSTAEQIQAIKLQFQLLHPFLKDIEGLRFESAIEEAWVEEVEEIIQEARHAVDSFLQRPANQISSWKARRKLKGDVRSIAAGFAELLKRKDRYGFRFVRRDSSKFSCQHHGTRDDTIISSVLKRMNGYLNEKSDQDHVLGEVFSEVTSLCNQLESMHKLVDETGMNGSGYNSRMAWLEQMRNIVQNAEKCVQTFIDSSGIIGRSNHLFKTRAGIKLSREIDRVQHTVSLLVGSIKAYAIELREESNSVVGLEEDIQAVVSRLTNNEHHSAIFILGIGGIGKTTLANKIFDHETVVRHFPRRIWISLPWKSNVSWIQEAHDIIDDERYS